MNAIFVVNVFIHNHVRQWNDTKDSSRTVGVMEESGLSGLYLVTQWVEF